jgi:hypothetical protein
MRSYRFARVAALTLVAASFLAGCAGTNMTNLWMDETAVTPMIDNVLVIALTRNQEARRFWEDTIAAEFNAQGLLARQSYQLFPADLPDSQQVAVVMERDKHDAAIVAHRLYLSANQERGSGYRENAPAAHLNYWRRGYNVAYSAAIMPKSMQNVDHDEDARFVMDVARTDGRLVWTGTTIPIDAKDGEKLRTEVAGQIVPELQRKKIIAKE